MNDFFDFVFELVMYVDCSDVYWDDCFEEKSFRMGGWGCLELNGLVDLFDWLNFVCLMFGVVIGCVGVVGEYVF